MARFVIRDENFGAVIYDRNRLKYKFLTKKDLTQPITMLGVLVEDIERWETDLSSAPKNLIYSPLRIYFELTSKCNLRCKTCFNSSGDKEYNELSLSEIKSSLLGIRSNNIIDIRFTGGEPTLHKNWFEVLQYAKELGFVVSINTNGIYSDPEAINKLTSLNLEQITLSLDGDREFHDYIRGAGSFDKTITSLEKLHSLKAKLRMNTVLTKGSKKDLEAILNIAKKYVEEINFFYMRLAGRACNILDLKLSYEELHEFGKQIEVLKPKYPLLNILHSSQIMLMRSIGLDASLKFGLQLGGPDGFMHLNLLPDGSIWPGGYTPHLNNEYNLGNIKDENYDLLRVWRYNPKLNEFRKKSLDLQRKCMSCVDKGVKCPGASMEMELYREKTKEKINPYCLF